MFLTVIFRDVIGDLYEVSNLKRKKNNYIMNYLITFVKKIMPKEIPKPVGRIENCNNQMNRKIDLSNEDHCGPCGEYMLEKTQHTNNKNKTEPKNNKN